MCLELFETILKGLPRASVKNGNLSMPKKIYTPMDELGKAASDPLFSSTYETSHIRDLLCARNSGVITEAQYQSGYDSWQTRRQQYNHQQDAHEEAGQEEQAREQETAEQEAELQRMEAQIQAEQTEGNWVTGITELAIILNAITQTRSNYYQRELQMQPGRVQIYCPPGWNTCTIY